jgi:hypothetical protein
MFRFTIRDVLWLMVVAAVACGWIREVYRSPGRRVEFRAQAMEWKFQADGWKIKQPSQSRVIITNGPVSHEFTKAGNAIQHKLNP